MSLETVTVETDTGFFYPINREKSYVRIGSTSQDIDPAGNGDLIKIILTNGNKETQYQRSYKKYDLISAEVSGVIGVLTIVLKFLLVPYFENGFYAELVRNTFDITFEQGVKKKIDFVELIRKKRLQDQQQEENRDGNIPDYQVQAINTESNGEFLSRNANESGNNQDYSEQLDENYNVDIDLPPTNPIRFNQKFNPSSDGGGCFSEINKYQQKPKDLPQNILQQAKKKKLHMNFFEYATCLFLCKKKQKARKKILEIGIAKIRRELDISTLVHKIKEFDRLKYCILTQEQLTLFNNLPKPKLTIESTEFDEDPLKGMQKKGY